jgi:hypothetical protein
MVIKGGATLVLDVLRVSPEEVRSVLVVVATVVVVAVVVVMVAVIVCVGAGGNGDGGGVGGGVGRRYDGCDGSIARACAGACAGAGAGAGAFGVGVTHACLTLLLVSLSDRRRAWLG